MDCQYKVKQIHNLQVIMGLKGCKWSSLNVSGTKKPLTNPFHPFFLLSSLRGNKKWAKLYGLEWTRKTQLLDSWSKENRVLENGLGLGLGDTLVLSLCQPSMAALDARPKSDF